MPTITLFSLKNRKYRPAPPMPPAAGSYALRPIH